MRALDNEEINMKPMFGKMLEQALKLAIIDCCGFVIDEKTGRERMTTDAEQHAWLKDIYSIPQKLWNDIDPGALGQNLACRVLGAGGWMLGETYTGNSSAREVFDISFPDGKLNPNADLIGMGKAAGVTIVPVSSIEELSNEVPPTDD